MLRKLAFTGVSAVSLFVLTPPAEAQIARVFVSVTGNDANVCSNVLTPCRTFGGGIAQVDAHGEVIVMDSGSYAGGTITKSVKINVAAGVVAFSGLPITVNPGIGGIVVMRGLTVKSVSPGSGTGITHQSGTLFVENTVVDGWFSGVTSTSGAERLFVKGSVFRNHNNAGVWVVSGSMATFAIDQSFFENNTSTGILLEGGTGRVSNSVMTANAVGALVVESEAAFQRCEVSGNNSAGLSASFAGALRVSGSTVTRNGFGLQQSGGAILESFGNNVVRGNTANTSGTITMVALQ